MKVKFADICIIKSSKRIFENEYVDDGVPFIRGQEISDGSLLAENATFECYISHQRYNELKNKYGVPVLGDILITAVGTIGNLYYVDKKRDFYFKDGNVILFTSFSEKVNSKYLYYYMRSPLFKKQLEYAMIGAVQKALTMVMLNKIEIDLPTIEKQNAIVRILEKIDSKISNNNKINAELESMAKTLYDYWFLQFEFPNEEGKPYKSSSGKMVWNEELKREIPEGWEVQTVKKCIHHINTGLNPRDNFKLGNGHIKYITVKNLTVNGTIDFSDCDQIDEEARKIVHKRSDVSRGDILFASIAPLGRCVIVQENPRDWDINESVFCIRPNLNKVSTELLYMFFMSDYFVKKAEHSSTGSVFNGIRISTLEEMLILIPTKSIKDKFTDTVKNIFAKKYQNEKENQEIISIRDFLLPLLMNGQVGFKE